MPDSFPNKPGPFESTAHYYARFRKPYPQEIFRAITDRFQLDGTGNLLDVGCGTGLLSLPIAEKFEGVTGIDPDPEMIEEARHQAEHLGVENAGFLVASGEDVEPGMGKFRLVLFGSSLHWMDIDDVLARARAVLTPGGGIAICGMPSLWGGESEWERAIAATASLLRVGGRFTVYDMRTTKAKGPLGWPLTRITEWWVNHYGVADLEVDYAVARPWKATMAKYLTAIVYQEMGFGTLFRCSGERPAE